MANIFQKIIRQLGQVQFYRFLIIGTFNTVFDFIFVNLLAYFFGVYQGTGLLALNSISFITVVTISFYLNKNWTFKERNDEQNNKQKYLIFFLVTLVGLSLNNFIVYLITTVVGPQFGLSDFVWLNVAKALAVGVVLFWNFFNYKFIVFKKNINNDLCSEK